MKNKKIICPCGKQWVANTSWVLNGKSDGTTVLRMMCTCGQIFERDMMPIIRIEKTKLNMNYDHRYDSVHKWLRSTFGKANECVHCKNTTAKRYEYALLKGKNYEKNRDNYIQLCKVCHAKYDGVIERLTKNKYVKVIATLNQSTFPFDSIQEAVKATCVSKTSISNCLHGRSLSAGGYKWTYV